MDAHTDRAMSIHRYGAIFLPRALARGGPMQIYVLRGDVRLMYGDPLYLARRSGV